MIQDLVVEVHDLLDRHRIAHAFGGALALVQYAEPRGTVDIDLNVARDFTERAEVVGILEGAGLRPLEPEESWLPVAGVRFARAGELATLDVFFGFDDYHVEMINRARTFPFVSSEGAFELPFLAADDLVVMKLSFNRPKDWVDVQSMIEAGTPLDPDYVTDRLVHLRGSTMYPRTARLRSLLSSSE